MAKEGTLTKLRGILRQRAFLFNTDDGRVSITQFILLLGLSPWQGMERG